MTSSLSFTTTAAERELAAREADGIHVTLLWHPQRDDVTVAVDDRRLDIQFRVLVPAHRALHAFEHPFAYAT